MLALAVAKGRTGRALGNRTLQTESRVTLIDAFGGGGSPRRARRRLLRTTRGEGGAVLSAERASPATARLPSRRDRSSYSPTSPTEPRRPGLGHVRADEKSNPRPRLEANAQGTKASLWERASGSFRPLRSDDVANRLSCFSSPRYQLGRLLTSTERHPCPATRC
jgi:hypothetical protein